MPTELEKPVQTPDATQCDAELFELSPVNRAKFLKLYEWEHRGVPERQRLSFHDWFDAHITEVSDKAEKYVAGLYYRKTLKACDDMAAAKGITRQQMAKTLGFSLRKEDGGQ